MILHYFKAKFLFSYPIIIISENDAHDYATIVCNRPKLMSNRSIIVKFHKQQGQCRLMTLKFSKPYEIATYIIRNTHAWSSIST